MKNRVYIASDHAGFELKEEILKVNRDLLLDLGTKNKDRVDYPDFALTLVENIEKDKESKGILICGTGIGISMAANRNSNVRAAVCHNITYAKLAREHNNANILCLPGRFMEFDDAWAITKTFLKTPFSNEDRHKKRLEMFKWE